MQYLVTKNLFPEYNHMFDMEKAPFNYETIACSFFCTQRYCTQRIAHTTILHRGHYCTQHIAHATLLYTAYCTQEYREF